MNINLNLISDFNLEILKRILISKNIEGVNKVNTSDYGQLYQSIYKFETNLDTINFIWSLPETHIKNFRKLLNSEPISKDELLKEIDDYAELIINLSKKSKYIFIPSWSILSYYRKSGYLDWDQDNGIARFITEMNLKLAKKFDKHRNIYIFNSDDWGLGIRENLNPKMWYLTKTPFQNKVFNEVCDSLSNLLRILLGKSKKLIILDLDNTLWGGIIGDVDFNGINIGGHNYLGEAYKDFQNGLLTLHNQGILLAIVSKNDEKIAMRAFELNPEMILKKKHFVSWKINWEDKSENIIKIAEEINISLDSIVFIDDNPVERDQVKSSLPEVFVPEWPIDPTIYKIKLTEMRCFDKLSISDDDTNRTKSYKDNIKRVSFKKNIPCKKEWLLQLNTIIDVGKLDIINLKRVGQLFNKTNQFNLKTRRLTESEILDFYSTNGNQLFTVNVQDKFGSLGLVALIGLRLKNKRELEIADLILSCRAMGRGVEESILYIIQKEAIKLKASSIIFKYNQTNKNEPILKFLKSKQLITKDNITFKVLTSTKFLLPDYLKINYV